MSEVKTNFLHLVYNQEHLHIQNKSVLTSMTLNSDENGKVNMDYDYYRKTLPLKDYGYFKECLSILYKYKWLIKDDNNNTYLNFNKKTS